MSLSTKDFVTLVREQVAAIQGAARTLVDLTVGSILRAAVEACAGVVLWLQALILQLLTTTRASTSTGSDLDTWVADFGLARLAALAATGSVTFSRFTTTLQAVVPLGSVVQTADGSQQYAVALDATNASYRAALGGYVLAAGVASVTVPVTAVTPGSGGNAAAGQITTIAQAMPGIDTVTNALPFTNGTEAESDPALRTRFVEFLASLAEGTKAAIIYAVTSVQSSVTCTVVENQDYNGTQDYGYFTVIVDDGSGSPSTTFLNTVANAVEAVRACTIRFGVFPPVVESAAIVMTATVAAGYDPAATKAAARAAVLAYVNSLQLGQSLPYTRVAQVAYVPGVTNITGLTLNSGTADLSASALQVIKCASCTVN